MRTNGTAAGTTLVKDIFPGSYPPGSFSYSPPPPHSSFPAYLTNVNGTLFFSANDGIHGTELWESNGTLAGTSLVNDIGPTSAGSYPRYLTNVNGQLFFSADDGFHGFEPWALSVPPPSDTNLADQSVVDAAFLPGSEVGNVLLDTPATLSATINRRNANADRSQVGIMRPGTGSTPSDYAVSTWTDNQATADALGNALRQAVGEEFPIDLTWWDALAAK